MIKATYITYSNNLGEWRKRNTMFNSRRGMFRYLMDVFPDGYKLKKVKEFKNGCLATRNTDKRFDMVC